MTFCPELFESVKKIIPVVNSMSCIFFKISRTLTFLVCQDPELSEDTMRSTEPEVQGLGFEKPSSKKEE